MENNRKTWDNRTKPQERNMSTLILNVNISKARRGTGEQITTIGKPMKAERTSKETTRKTIRNEAGKLKTTTETMGKLYL